MRVTLLTITSGCWKHKLPQVGTTFLASLQSNRLDAFSSATVKHWLERLMFWLRVLLKADGLEAKVDALVSLEKPAVKGQPPYEPHLAIGTHAVAKEDKIRLAFMGYVLGNGHRHRPPTGVIINIAGDAQRIQLPKLMANLESAIETLETWRMNLPSDPPPIHLNDHCPICPFKKNVSNKPKRMTT